LVTTVPTNDLKITVRRFTWNASDIPIAMELKAPSWLTTFLEAKKPEEVFELETFSRRGCVLQILSLNTQLSFRNYEQIAAVTQSEGDLPFYVYADDYATSISPLKFEMTGNTVFNLDQRENVAFALFTTKELQKSTWQSYCLMATPMTLVHRPGSGPGPSH
jgi:hypothetical protein